MIHYKIYTSADLTIEQKEQLKVSLADVRHLLGDDFCVEVDPIDNEEYRDKWFAHTVQEIDNINEI